jgi:hypothetical protein
MEHGRARVSLGRVDRAVLNALLPSEASPLLTLGILETDFESFLADFGAAAPGPLRRAFRLGLLAAGWVAPLLVRRLPPMTRLAPAERGRALAAMERSRVPELRQLVRVLKTVVSLHYGALPAVRRALGHHQ